MANGNGDLRVEQVALADLKPHPRNYRAHPAAQLEHLVASQEQFGVYRNVVIAKDGTILAGHGVVEAARQRGDETIPAVRMEVGPNSEKALKLMVLDNQVSRLAEDAEDDLAALLKEIGDADNLLATGYDSESLGDLLLKLSPGKPDDFREYDPEAMEFDHQCPKCGYQWSE